MIEETSPADDVREETAAASPEVKAQDELGALRDEVARLKNEVLYAQADTQNVRRRLEKDKADSVAYASTNFAREILSIADNLSRALQAIPAELRDDAKLKPLVTGIEMTGKEIDTVFARHGITRIEAIGAKLDPNRHQAMVELPSADKEPGTIVQEMQAGYMLKDRLLRPALVGVAKAAETSRVDASA